MGFSLIELAIVLVVLGLLTSGLLSALQVALLRSRIADTRNAMTQAQEALFAYAVAHQSLPCPAQSPLDGSAQSRSTGACAQRRGLLPWQELGLRGTDAWGRRLGYVVSQSLVVAPGSRITLASAGEIALIGRDANGTTTSMASSGAVAFALWSHGENGSGGFTEAGAGVGDLSDTNFDEDSNSSAPGTSATVVVRDGAVSAHVAGGEFDDLVAWGSRYVLFSRMIAAGQLP